jgi:hypothetical protein
MTEYAFATMVHLALNGSARHMLPMPHALEEVRDILLLESVENRCIVGVEGYPRVQRTLGGEDESSWLDAWLRGFCPTGCALTECTPIKNLVAKKLLALLLDSSTSTCASNTKRLSADNSIISRKPRSDRYEPRREDSTPKTVAIHDIREDVAGDRNRRSVGVKGQLRIELPKSCNLL